MTLRLHSSIFPFRHILNLIFSSAKSSFLIRVVLEWGPKGFPLCPEKIFLGGTISFSHPLSFLPALDASHACKHACCARCCCSLPGRFCKYVYCNYYTYMHQLCSRVKLMCVSSRFQLALRR